MYLYVIQNVQIFVFYWFFFLQLFFKSNYCLFYSESLLDWEVVSVMGGTNIFIV